MIENPKQSPVVLSSERIRLRPVQVKDAELFSQIAPLETFRYYVSAVPKEATTQGFEPYVSYLLDQESVQGYVAELIETGEAVGSTCYLDIRPADDQVEIGMTWYAPKWRGTFVNPECKLLLLSHAFDTLGCTKVTLKCDDRNEHSKRAITKLGAKFEGTLRRHRFNDFGEFRNTTYFGILSEEWPEVKTRLADRIRSLES
jgi:N-acetyltransferase